jgi:hypothetical protein
VHVVHQPYPEPAEVAEHPPRELSVSVVAGVVEDEEPLARGHSVVELAVAAEEAVGEEGEEDAGEDAEEQQRGGEAGAPVGEGRGQRLERQRRARREQLSEVGYARQRLVHRCSRRRRRRDDGGGASSCCRGGVVPPRMGLGGAELSRISSDVVVAAAMPACAIGMRTSSLPFDVVPAAAIHECERCVPRSGVVARDERVALI